jgi:hypothetical protein
MRALGRLFDVGTGWAPVDIDTANGATGKRVNLSNASGITFLVFCGAGGAEDLVLDVQQATASTGGTSNDCDSANGATGVTTWYIKAETTLDNDESWVKVTQSEASEVTVVGATYGAMQKMIAIYVGAEQLADGYAWVSLNAAITTATSQLGACLYILHDLHVQRDPVLLGNLLLPGAANA